MKKRRNRVSWRDTKYTTDVCWDVEGFVYQVDSTEHIALRVATLNHYYFLVDTDLLASHRVYDWIREGALPYNVRLKTGAVIVQPLFNTL